MPWSLKDEIDITAALETALGTAGLDIRATFG
jgi:hypothetical protein